MWLNAKRTECKLTNLSFSFDSFLETYSLLNFFDHLLNCLSSFLSDLVKLALIALKNKLYTLQYNTSGLNALTRIT